MHVDLSQFHGKRVCVALSGGGDSVALFHYLKTHAEENGILLSALNIEHGIRGEYFEFLKAYPDSGSIHRAISSLFRAFRYDGYCKTVSKQANGLDFCVKQVYTAL